MDLRFGHRLPGFLSIQMIDECELQQDSGDRADQAIRGCGLNDNRNKSPDKILIAFEVYDAIARRSSA